MDPHNKPFKTTSCQNGGVQNLITSHKAATLKLNKNKKKEKNKILSLSLTHGSSSLKPR